VDLGSGINGERCAIRREARVFGEGFEKRGQVGGIERELERFPGGGLVCEEPGGESLVGRAGRFFGCFERDGDVAFFERFLP